MGYDLVKRTEAMHGQGQGPWRQKALTFKVGGTQWIEWKGLLSETPRPSTPQKEQEHKAVGLRAGGAGGPKVKASERLRWQMRQREFLRPGT